MPEKELEQIMEFIENMEDLIGRKKSRILKQILLKEMIRLMFDTGKDNAKKGINHSDDVFFLFQAIEGIIPVLKRERKSVKLRIQMKNRMYRTFQEVLDNLNLEKDEISTNERKNNWVISVKGYAPQDRFSVLRNSFHQLRQIR